MSFNNDGYEVVPNFLQSLGIDIDLVEKYFKSKFLNSYNKECTTFPIIGKGESYFYADELMEVVLERSVPLVENIVGKKIFPCYSYTRQYVKGNELPIHKDRKSCEISATLSISFEGSEINPIYFSDYKNGDDAAEILLNPGDMCLYKGIDLWHWRPPIKNEWYIQSMLHFVDAEGPYAHLKYDRRQHLGERKGHISVKLDRPHPP